MAPLMKTQGEGSPGQASVKYHITYVRRPVTRYALSKGKGILQDTQKDLQEAEAILQETLLNLQDTQKLDKEGSVQQETKKEDPELREPSPQPNLDSYYRFIEWGRVVPQKFSIPLFFELEKERARTHRWMQIAKSKGVDDIGLMEENIKEMGRELSSLRDREAMMKAQLEAKNAWLKGQLQERGNQLASMANLSLEAIQCRMLAKSYELYLKEHWLQLQINTLAQRGTMPFQGYRQFIALCDQSTLEDRDKLFEFYLHNLALTYLNVWDPNAKLGDLQLMALASWMNHEEPRAVEMKKIMAREETKPLMIRAEQSNPMAVISTHNLISNDPQLVPRYLSSQEKSITHFDDMFRLSGDESMQACQRRWNTLPYSFKTREYHSPQRMREALNRTPMYKQTLQRLKVNWIGLRLSPPLMLGMLEGRKEEKERKNWEEIERKAGFYAQEEETTTEACDVREATRAMKDMDID